MAYSDARDHVDVCGQYCLQNPDVSLWSILLLTVKGKQSTLPCIDECGLTAEKEDMEDYCDNL